MSADDREATAAEREIHERKRAEIVATVPASYVPALHLALPTVFGLAVCITAAAFIRDLRPVEALVFPITIVLGWAFEWRAHKSVLHERQPGLGVLYVRHELQHHVVYRYDDMALRSKRELALILMPAYAIVLVFGLNTPLAFGLALLLGWNSALVYLVASMLFFLAYEWMHLSYHLPSDSFVGRRKIVRVLREVHRRHHDPALMKRWNFNVTVPLLDWIHGTLWSPERFRAKEAERAARQLRAE
jgi:hypothetical protein